MVKKSIGFFMNYIDIEGKEKFILDDKFVKFLFVLKVCICQSLIMFKGIWVF